MNRCCIADDDQSTIYAPVVKEILVCVYVLFVVFYWWWATAYHTREYLPLRHNVIPSRDAQTGTACPYFFIICMKSDKLRRRLKCTCFVIKPRANLVAFLSVQWRQIACFFFLWRAPLVKSSGGASSPPPWPGGVGGIGSPDFTRLVDWLPPAN